MNILSIESSCDDSSLALQNLDCNLLWHRKISQENAHTYFGGVVPELASRLFAKDLPYLLGEFKEKHSFNNLCAIAVTYEPGLATSLLEGVIMAKGLSLSLNVPLLGINHLKGHIYSLFINQPMVKMPISVLLVSGGHTMIIECFDYDNMQIISSTLDDSFGECYDKAAKMLSLGYPGGMVIDSLAREALNDHVTPIKLPVPLMHTHTLHFSFSGLKNAFRLALQEQKELQKLIESHSHYTHSLHNTAKNPLANKQKHHSLLSHDLSSQTQEAQKIKQQILAHPSTKALSLGLQQSAVTHLLQKCEKYLKSTSNIPYFAVVGGASANSLLRDKIQDLVAKYQKKLLLADMQYCSDNAAMIGRAALAYLESNPQALNKNNAANCLNLDITTHNTEITNNHIERT
ncbi:tRNA (adenosine(37)-N6)-threonylcarbamoyltransferase complex transferase subunit TsaD [Helicobacter aurati]|uniref:tRNA N6-adenosine threonylcarbamoyltransferase n=1 Tax=Helicobacter aurati TaxID=137778 RepID=A0A3D8J660_9HELI|nr:tRNA (adenosine(37)-N6)-threonylcarbamoyltransferase complex transferase subunit TsaD [Helicobacter aurati]RDU72685.1 tRNA (adenosine(37)-N6)-threonylcarbamoyltransferase complex transferase subunit TsaD [Helicobacter aurati]